MTSFDLSFIVPSEGDGRLLVLEVTIGGTTFPVTKFEIDERLERSVLPRNVALYEREADAALKDGRDVHIQGATGREPSGPVSAKLLVIPGAWPPDHGGVDVRQSPPFPLSLVFVDEDVRILGSDFLEAFSVDRQVEEDGSEVVTLNYRAAS